jgi:hypothetical protein
MLTATMWLFGALACGIVLAFVLLFLSGRSAAALEVPTVGAVVQDPVGAVTKTVTAAPAPDVADPPVAGDMPPADSSKTDTPKPDTPTVSLPKAADPIAETPGGPPASSAPAAASPGPVAPGLGGITQTVAAPIENVVAPITGGVANVAEPVVNNVVAPVVDKVATPLLNDVVIPVVNGVVAPVAGVVDDVGRPLGGALAPVTPIPPPDLSSGPRTPSSGGTARRLLAPTGAPIPLTSDVAVAGTAAAMGTEPPLGLPARASSVTRASAVPVPTPLPTPRDHRPLDLPAQSVPPPATPSTGDNGRAPTFVFHFAIVLAAAVLALEASRRLALLNRLPQTQFLTVLIERPG